MCRRTRKVSLLICILIVGGERADNECLAPDPKPKKNRELKTEILPVTVTPVGTKNPVGTKTLAGGTTQVSTPVLGAQTVAVPSASAAPPKAK